MSRTLDATFYFFFYKSALRSVCMLLHTHGFPDGNVTTTRTHMSFGLGIIYGDSYRKCKAHIM